MNSVDLLSRKLTRPYVGFGARERVKINLLRIGLNILNGTARIAETPNFDKVCSSHLVASDIRPLSFSFRI